MATDVLVSLCDKKHSLYVAEFSTSTRYMHNNHKTPGALSLRSILFKILPRRLRHSADSQANSNLRPNRQLMDEKITQELVVTTKQQASRRQSPNTSSVPPQKMPDTLESMRKILVQLFELLPCPDDSENRKTQLREFCRAQFEISEPFIALDSHDLLTRLVDFHEKCNPAHKITFIPPLPVRRKLCSSVRFSMPEFLLSLIRVHEVEDTEDDIVRKMLWVQTRMAARFLLRQVDSFDRANCSLCDFLQESLCQETIDDELCAESLVCLKLWMCEDLVENDEILKAVIRVSQNKAKSLDLRLKALFSLLSYIPGTGDDLVATSMWMHRYPEFVHSLVSNISSTELDPQLRQACLLTMHAFLYETQRVPKQFKAMLESLSLEMLSELAAKSPSPVIRTASEGLVWLIHGKAKRLSVFLARFNQGETKLALEDLLYSPHLRKHLSVPGLGLFNRIESWLVETCLIRSNDTQVQIQALRVLTSKWMLENVNRKGELSLAQWALDHISSSPDLVEGCSKLLLSFPKPESTFSDWTVNGLNEESAAKRTFRKVHKALLNHIFANHQPMSTRILRYFVEDEGNATKWNSTGLVNWILQQCRSVGDRGDMKSLCEMLQVLKYLIDFGEVADGFTFDCVVSETNGVMDTIVDILILVLDHRSSPHDDRLRCLRLVLETASLLFHTIKSSRDRPREEIVDLLIHYLNGNSVADADVLEMTVRLEMVDFFIFIRQACPQEKRPVETIIDWAMNASMLIIERDKSVSTSLTKIGLWFQGEMLVRLCKLMSFRDNLQSFSGFESFGVKYHNLFNQVVKINQIPLRVIQALQSNRFSCCKGTLLEFFLGILQQGLFLPGVAEYFRDHLMVPIQLFSWLVNDVILKDDEDLVDAKCQAMLFLAQFNWSPTTTTEPAMESLMKPFQGIMSRQISESQRQTLVVYLKTKLICNVETKAELRSASIVLLDKLDTVVLVMRPQLGVGSCDGPPSSPAVTDMIQWVSTELMDCIPFEAIRTFKCLRDCFTSHSPFQVPDPQNLSDSVLHTAFRLLRARSLTEWRSRRYLLRLMLYWCPRLPGHFTDADMTPAFIELLLDLIVMPPVVEEQHMEPAEEITIVEADGWSFSDSKAVVLKGKEVQTLSLRLLAMLVRSRWLPEEVQTMILARYDVLREIQSGFFYPNSSVRTDVSSVLTWWYEVLDQRKSPDKMEIADFLIKCHLGMTTRAENVKRVREALNLIGWPPQRVMRYSMMMTLCQENVLRKSRKSGLAHIPSDVIRKLWGFLYSDSDHWNGGGFNVNWDAWTGGETVIGTGGSWTVPTFSAAETANSAGFDFGGGGIAGGWGTLSGTLATGTTNNAGVVFGGGGVVGGWSFSPGDTANTPGFGFVRGGDVGGWAFSTTSASEQTGVGAAGGFGGVASITFSAPTNDQTRNAAGGWASANNTGGGTGFGNWASPTMSSYQTNATTNGGVSAGNFSSSSSQQ